MLSITAFVAFLLLAMLGLPIAHALITGALVGLLQSDRLTAELVVEQLVTQTQSFPLIAIPFFMLTGTLMVGGKLGQHLIDMLTTMMGRFHGGPAQVGVLSSTIFGGVSGSAVADASAIGSLLIPWLKKLGYPSAVRRRHDRGRGDHRHPDSAVDPDDHLCAGLERVDRRAVRRRHPARHHHVRRLHAGLLHPGPAARLSARFDAVQLEALPRRDGICRPGACCCRY